MICPSCKAEAVPGTRWCKLCHGNLVNPEIGRLAEPVKRILATVVDGFALILVIAVATSIAWGGDFPLLALLLWMAYVCVFVYLFRQGQTPGKKLVGVRVIKESGAEPGLVVMILRECLGKWIAGMIFGLGFIWVLIDEGNQGWHDKLLNTYVVDTKSPAIAVSG